VNWLAVQCWDSTASGRGLGRRVTVGDRRTSGVVGGANSFAKPEVSQQPSSASNAATSCELFEEELFQTLSHTSNGASGGAAAGASFTCNGLVGDRPMQHQNSQRSFVMRSAASSSRAASSGSVGVGSSTPCGVDDAPGDDDLAKSASGSR
jgi:hypothetical protein